MFQKSSAKLLSWILILMLSSLSSSCTLSSGDDVAVTGSHDDAATQTECSAEDTTAQTEYLTEDTTTETEITTQADMIVESDTSIEVYTEPETDTVSDPVFLNPNGIDFARSLTNAAANSTGSIVQYWDTGKEKIKFESIQIDDCTYQLSINDQIVGSAVRFSQILVTDDYIIMIPGGTDINSSSIRIFDYSGELLFATQYLSTAGMVTMGSVSIEDDKIFIRGTRITHGPSLMIGFSASRDDQSEDFSYLYEDPIPDFIVPYDPEPQRSVYLYEPALNDAEKEAFTNLNRELLVQAVFELDYLGDGKFSNIKLTNDYQTLGEYLEECSKLWSSE